MELHEQTRYRRLLPARLREPVFAEVDRGSGSGKPGDQDGHHSEHEKTKPGAHATALLT